MTRLVLLALFALACGDGRLPPEDCEPPLPDVDDEGDPWPTYTEANARLANCTDDALTRRRGICADGKSFIARAGGYEADTYYFDGEVLVGLRRSSDVGYSCTTYRFGDTGCEERDVEEVDCP
jgi:hypothetical protein